MPVSEIEYDDLVKRCLEIELTLGWDAEHLPPEACARMEAEAHRLHETLHDVEREAVSTSARDDR